MFDSLRGQFLVAGKRLRDPNFYKTLVLMVEHGSDGAMGLVVNRPSSVTVAHVLSAHFEVPKTDDVVYVGGPVEPTALFILHNAPQFDAGEPPVVPGLYVGSNEDVFETVVEQAGSGDPSVRFRIFSGCAGWGSGQLESELDRGDWYLYPASPELMFQDDPYAAYDLVLQKVHASNRILPHTSDNPEWN